MITDELITDHQLPIMNRTHKSATPAYRQAGNQSLLEIQQPGNKKTQQ